MKPNILKTIPFQYLYQIAEDLYQSKLEQAESFAQQQLEEKLLRHEVAYTSTHEAPSEVSFADAVVAPEIDKAKLRYLANQEAVKDVWIPKYKLEPILLSVMPQIIAHLGNKLVRWSEVMTVEGKIDGLKVLRQAFDFSSDWEKGLYIFLMLDSRSVYLSTQYKGESRAYCALVPLILYAFKLNQKTKYSQWDRSTLHWVVNRSLCEAMLWEQPTPSRDELLKARELGLIYQSGAKAGQMRNPQTTYRLFATKGGALEGYPHLVGAMLTQIWCAHPQNRTQYMVLDPHNWDRMPTPLISENIFASPMPTSLGSTTHSDTMPWI